MDIHEFTKLPVLGILRGIEQNVLEPLLESVVLSGLKTLEITMNTLGAGGLIKDAVRISRGRLMIGAGTVLSRELLIDALDAGASFVVLPTCIPEVVDYCVAHKIPVFPGALTPQEIYHAWTAGATMVKVFPSECFGPAYFKTVKAPFNDIKLLACGGVNASNIKDFFDNGADAVAFGASIFRKELLAQKDFTTITRSIEKLLAGIPETVTGRK